MKVLIVKTSALGDVVHALPVLAYLKGRDKALEIGWLVEDPFLPLLHGHPMVGKVHSINTKRWRNSKTIRVCRQVHRVVAELRRERYDVALDLQGNAKSGVFTLLSGSPLRCGFDRKAVREWPNLLATNRRISLTDADHHITDRALRIVRRAFPGGFEPPPAGPLVADRESLNDLELQLQRHGLTRRKLVLLHYGTTWVTKQFSIPFWAGVISRIVANDDTHLILTWGNQEERAAAMALQEPLQHRASVWSRIHLKQLIALLARVDLVLGGDTGPVHIAAALGTPTISLYRATDARRNGPRGQDHLCIQSPMPCSPCLRKQCSDDPACSGSIDVETVLEAAQNFMNRHPTDRKTLYLAYP